MGALSMDLRVRAVEAVDGGARVAQVAAELRVSERWLYKLLQQRRDGHGLEPQYAGRCGRPTQLSPDREVLLRQDVQDHPDATLAERVERLKLPVTITQTWRWLKQLDFSHKKRRSSPAKDSAPTSRKSARTGSRSSKA